MKTVTFENKIIKALNADNVGAFEPTVSIENIDTDKLHITAKYYVAQKTTAGACRISLNFPKDPEFVWTPHITPTDKNIVTQHVFRTPALIFEYENATAILYPDIECFKKYNGLYYLDLNAPEGIMEFGISDSEVEGHIRFIRSGSVDFEGEFEISFFLELYDKKLDDPFKPVLDYYWKNYGEKQSLYMSPARKDPDKYVEHTYNWAFDSWKDKTWQEFDVDGKTLGAVSYLVTVQQSPNWKEQRTRFESYTVWNQAWFCSLRSAMGLFRYAKRTNNAELLDYALKTKELALSFPQDDGLFDAVIGKEVEYIEENGVKVPHVVSKAKYYFGNSDRNPFAKSFCCGPKGQPRHILDMSFTAYHMLCWYKELEADKRLLDYAVRYADKLITMQYDNGFFPAWLDENGKSTGVLDYSPESAMSAVFLIELAKLTGCEKYAISAQKALTALKNEIVYTGRWEDFETYWSCSSYWRDHVGVKFRRNNVYKQCNLSIYYTAWAFLEGYLYFNNDEYLNIGKRTVDELLMYQSSYQPEAFNVSVVGGFGVMNADAELNDSRQGLFCELVVRFGEILGDSTYISRGKAAMRASFSMMYCPENPETKEQWEKVWKHFGPEDYGFMMENYGHTGKADNEGTGIGHFTIYDWGNGAAAETYERMRAHYGEDFIKPEE